MLWRRQVHCSSVHSEQFALQASGKLLQLVPRGGPDWTRFLRDSERGQTERRLVLQRGLLRSLGLRRSSLKSARFSLLLERPHLMIYHPGDRRSCSGRAWEMDIHQLSRRATWSSFRTEIHTSLRAGEASAEPQQTSAVIT